MVTAWLGWVQLVLTSLCWGTMWLPVKKYRTYDGITFQWFLCSGVMFSAVIISIVLNAHNVTFDFHLGGVLGGVFQMLSNAMIVPMVKRMGLGVGYSCWIGFGTAWGYTTSRLGLFGLEKHEKPTGWINDMGVCVALIAVMMFAFINAEKHTRKPHPKIQARNSNLQTILAESMMPDSQEEDSDDDIPVRPQSFTYSPRVGDPMSIDSPRSNRSHSFSLGMTSDMEFDDELESFFLTGFEPISTAVTRSSNAPKQSKKTRLVGLFICLIQGLLTGSGYISMSVWQQHQSAGSTSQFSALGFLFSQALGQYLASTVVLLVNSMWRRTMKKQKSIKEPLKLDARYLIPAMCSGCCWTIGASAMFMGVFNVGYTQGFVVSQLGPCFVSGMLALLRKEVTGRRNLRLFVGGLFTLIVGVGLIVV